VIKVASPAVLREIQSGERSVGIGGGGRGSFYGNSFSNGIAVRLRYYSFQLTRDIVLPLWKQGQGLESILLLNKAQPEVEGK
jgi:hypothetical protein